MPLNPEGATDLLLAFVCLGLATLRWRSSPGIATALAILGVAATLGVLHFAAISWAGGPHRFATLVSSTAAVPLLGWCLRWPDSLPAQQPRAAGIAIVFGGAIGVLLVGLAGIKVWGLLCVLVSAGLLVSAAWTQRSWRLRLGVALLLGAGIVQATQPGVSGLSAVAVLHLLLAFGLLLAVAPQTVARH